MICQNNFGKVLDPPFVGVFAASKNRVKKYVRCLCCKLESKKISDSSILRLDVFVFYKNNFISDIKIKSKSCFIKSDNLQASEGNPR